MGKNHNTTVKKEQSVLPEYLNRVSTNICQKARHHLFMDYNGGRFNILNDLASLNCIGFLPLLIPHQLLSE